MKPTMLAWKVYVPKVLHVQAVQLPTDVTILRGEELVVLATGAWLVRKPGGKLVVMEDAAFQRTYRLSVGLQEEKGIWK